MNIRTAFAANLETTETIESAKGMLNRSMFFSKVMIFLATFFNLRLDIYFSKITAKTLRVIRLIGAKSIQSSARSAFGILK